MSDRNITVPAVRVNEGEVIAYVGRIKASDILAVYDIRRWSETELDGYQRQLYEERKREIARYLRECPFPVIPAILVGVGQDCKFEPVDEDKRLGYLKIPYRKGAVQLIDGQHRVAGFQWYLEQLTSIEENERLGVPSEVDEHTSEMYRRILSYEIPVLFIDTEHAAKIVTMKDPEAQKKTERRDIERALFLILNKTQKGVRPSLKDTLQYMIWRAGIRGIPGLDDINRVKATELTLKLNSNGSPLSGMINASGARGMHRPVQLSSFVTSLEPLYDFEGFNRLSDSEKYQFVKTYWGVIKEMYPQAFDPKTWRKYLVLKTIGVYVLNRIARDYLKWAELNGEPVSAESIRKYLTPLRGFNWERENSPLRGFQGLGGVDVAYGELRDLLQKEHQRDKVIRMDSTEVQEA